jgi:hypothetical protein
MKIMLDNLKHNKNVINVIILKINPFFDCEKGCLMNDT